MRRLTRLMALGVATIVVLSGVIIPGRSQASVVATPGVTDNQILIGTSLPLSGLAVAFSIIAGGEKAYFDYVNAHGGVYGRKLKLLVMDDAYDPTRTLANVRTLVQTNNVFALLGVLGTANNVAIQPLLAAQKVPLIFPFAGSSLVIHPLRKYVFTYQPAYNVEATILTDYAAKTLHAKKIGIFYQADEFRQEGLNVVTAEAKKDGVQVVGDPNKTLYTLQNFFDVTSQVQTLQQAGADAVIIFAVPPAAGQFLTTAARLGFHPYMLSASAASDPNMFKEYGAATDGLYLAAWLPNYLTGKESAMYRSVLSTYADPKLAPISPYTEAGFAAAQLLVEGLKRAGRNLTRDGLVKAMEGLRGCKVCIAPNVKYSSKKHDGPEGAYVVQVHNGTFSTVHGYVYPSIP